jgi:cell division septation protein DedD
MHEVFEEEELPPVKLQRDTEVTLGPTILIGLFLGLLLLCGLCFGLGYSVGNHGARDSLAGEPAGAQAGVMAASSQAKPSAAPPVISQPPCAVDGLPATDAAGAAQSSGSTTVGGANSAQPLVKPALPATATEPELMVQIAAVSHQEDADVLIGALRKRGYAVNVRRETADGQFHVRVGPFTNRNDANAMRQKLLGDGYNAIVQP